MPGCNPGAILATVWFELNLAADQQVRLDTSNSTPNTTISVFTGDCSALAPVDCDYQYGTNGSATHGLVDFLAVGGMTYRIMVSGPFDAMPSDAVFIDALAGEGTPVIVVLSDAVTGAPVTGGHAQLRDTTGGWYLLREGLTGASGDVPLYPIWPGGDLDLEICAPGYVVDQRVVTLNGVLQRIDIPLQPQGSIPAPPDRPTRLVVGVTGGLVTLLPDGTDRRFIPIPYASDPTWSPDGSRIGLAAPDATGASQVWTCDADGTSVRVTTTLGFGGSAENLDWSPDGRVIAYEQGGVLHAVDVTAPPADPPAIGDMWNPSFSPNGLMIAGGASPGPRLARFDGVSTPMTVSSMVPVSAYSLAVSHDGMRVAFYEAPAGEGSLVVANVNGTGRQVVLSIPGVSLEEPTWSPDDTELAYIARTSDGPFLERVRLDGTGRRRLHEEPLGLGTSIDWAPMPTGAVGSDAAPRVTLLSPVGGEVVAPGDVMTIRWTAADDVGIAGQDLYWSNESGEQVIASGLGGALRSQDWTVPASAVSLGGARVRIVVHDSVGQDCHDASRYPFTVAGPGDPYLGLRMVAPAGGEMLSIGQHVPVEWDAVFDATPGAFSIELSRDDGFTWEGVASGIPDTDRTFDWIVPDVPATSTASLRVSAPVGMGFLHGRSGSFAIDFGGPSSQDLRIRRDPTGALVIAWTPDGGALSYDVIRGDLASLRRLADRVDLGTVACVADDLAGTSVTDPAVPLPGQALFWLSRANFATGPGLYGSTTDGLPLVPSAGDCP